jgi:hypothetical protein
VACLHCALTRRGAVACLLLAVRVVCVDLLMRPATWHSQRHPTGACWRSSTLPLHYCLRSADQVHREMEGRVNAMDPQKVRSRACMHSVTAARQCLLSLHAERQALGAQSRMLKLCPQCHAAAPISSSAPV